MRVIALIIALLPVAASAIDLSKDQRNAIEGRIQPFSQVRIELPRLHEGSLTRYEAAMGAPAAGLALPVALAPPLEGSVRVHSVWAHDTHD